MTAPDAGYTPDPADVELVAKVFITEAKKNPVDTSSPYSWGATTRVLFGPNEFDIGRAVLSALAATGRLAPAAEKRTEFGIKDSQREGVYPLRERVNADEVAAGDPDLSVVSRTVWVGPWLPAPTNTEESA